MELALTLNFSIIFKTVLGFQPKDKSVESRISTVFCFYSSKFLADFVKQNKRLSICI